MTLFVMQMLGSVGELLRTILKSVDPSKLAVHFHDTYGQALANILVALEVAPTNTRR